MALIRITGPLLVLFLMASPIYVQSTELCNTTITDFKISTNFTLTVSPQNLTANTNYTVNVTGLPTNSTVVLHALWNNVETGNWTANASNNCSHPIISNATSLVTAYWQSPASVNSSVILSAYIINGTEKYMVNKTLNAAPVSGASGSAKQHASLFTSLIQVFSLLLIMRYY